MKKILMLKEILELHRYVRQDAECPSWLISYAALRWADEIPYGVVTGDTGTVEEWLTDRLDYVIDEFHEYLNLDTPKEEEDEKKNEES